MRIVNPNLPTLHFYAGKCKNNEAPKHVTMIGEKKAATIDKKKVTLYDSPGSKDYIYVKMGADWLWIKNKEVFQFDKLETGKVTRQSKVATEDNPDGESLEA